MFQGLDTAIVGNGCLQAIRFGRLRSLIALSARLIHHRRPLVET